MNFDACTNAELIRMVDNDPQASARERALAQRLDEVMTEVTLITPLKPIQKGDMFND